MSAKCARCEKVVYPTEKLNCLDKTWHKMCFKCDQCGMTLNMKNYKGYNKLPYCNAHYPTTKFTAVSDTPENRRLRENTKNQSAIAYHAAFEKGKGQYTSVTDAPELLRLKKNQELVSSVTYHKDFEKMKGTKITVADDPETLRTMQNMRVASDIEYKGHRQQSADQEARRGLIGNSDGVHQMPRAPAPMDDFKSPYSARSQPGMSTAYTQQGKDHPNQPPPQKYYEPPPPQAPTGSAMPMKPMFRAIYDYVAADDDEVNFNEGDIIIDAEQIDEGWMTGTVKSTGQHGMLPSNYVEKY